MKFRTQDALEINFDKLFSILSANCVWRKPVTGERGKFQCRLIATNGCNIEDCNAMKLLQKEGSIIEKNRIERQDNKC